MVFLIFIGYAVLFQIKHFLADFPLQNTYMLGKFKEKYWLLPLAAHSGVHAIFTVLISLTLIDLKYSLLVGLFDFIVHFTMDRIKASPKLLGRFVALSKGDFERSFTHTALKLTEKDFKSNKYFWWSLGLDQMVHHITHYIIILIMFYIIGSGI